jgi:hypothetical protein
MKNKTYLKGILSYFLKTHLIILRYILMKKNAWDLLQNTVVGWGRVSVSVS